MPSGNIITASDVLNFLITGIDKTTLETELTEKRTWKPPALDATVYTQPYLERVSNHKKKIEIGLVRALR